LIGGGGADTLTGGLGADSLTGGDGADTFVQANGSSGSVVAGWINLAMNYYVYDQSIIIIGGFVDVITDFNSSADVLDATVQGGTDIYGPSVRNAGNYFARGYYSGGTFITDLGGSDIFFYVSTGADQTVAANIGTTSIVLMGAGSGFNSSNII